MSVTPPERSQRRPLVTLPAMRLQAMRGRLSEHLSPAQIMEVMQIVEDEIEVGSWRIGSLCDVERCRTVLVDSSKEHGNSVRHYSHCIIHGERGGGPFALVIAYAPIESL